MKQVLINELDKPLIDVSRLSSLIENGKPYKLFGFIGWGIEPIGLFEPYKGQNIFHHLSHKGVLSMVLPTFFGSKSRDILSREKSSLSKLNECINSVDASGLTPAHVAVIHNPTALQALSQVGAILTSEGYTAILQKNGGRAIASSPLEYIFQDEPTAHNFFTQSIRAGCVDIFVLLSKEHAKVQKHLLSYLPYVVQEVNKINTVNSSNVFSVIFQNYWPDILTVDHSSFTKVMRLINVLNDRNKDWNLSIEDWSGLLGARKFESSSQVLQHILRKCATKFLDNTLSTMQLEGFINVEAIDDGKFQQFKYYFAEGFSGPLGLVESRAVDSSEDIRHPPAEHVTVVSADARVLDAAGSVAMPDSVNLEKRHPVDRSAEKHKAKELGSVESQEVGVISTPGFSLMSEPASRPFIKPKAVTKVASIRDYAESVASCLQTSTKCTEHLKRDLGISYTQLHSFISMLALPGDFFGKVLHSAAKHLGLATKNTRDFLSEYIGELRAHDLLTTDNSKQLNAYGLACARDQVDLAKLLLNKGLELGIYSGNTNSVFEIPIRYHSSGMIEYLLKEQDGIIPDWHYVLSQAIKYADTKAIECYINSGSGVVRDITDRGGIPTEQGRYSILNKALDGLTELSRLRRFQEDKEREEAAVRKMSKLCECVKMMVQSGKIYYAEDNLVVLKKTFSLLKGLRESIKILLSDDIVEVVKSMGDIKDLIIGYYKSCELVPAARQFLEKLASDVDHDAVSSATFVTHISALSDLGRTGQLGGGYKGDTSQLDVSSSVPIGGDDSLVGYHHPPVLGESADDL